MTTPNWIDYFFEITLAVAKRSTCLRRKVGAIAVIDKQIIATGYNGAPKKITHCNVRGCYRQLHNIPSGQQHEACYGAHAETNLIAQAAYTGVLLRKAVIYCTTYPCSMCMKTLINAGISKVYYLEHYPDPLSQELAEEAGIPIIQHIITPT
jgi:dCMP deaminase